MPTSRWTYITARFICTSSAFEFFVLTVLGILLYLYVHGGLYSHMFSKYVQVNMVGDMLVFCCIG